MPGYTWANSAPNDFSVRWAPGSAHRDYEHVYAGDSEGLWHPEDGYYWVKLPDLKVRWKHGVESYKYPNIVAAKKEGTWQPKPGYEWISAEGVSGGVRWAPGVAHTDHPHVIAHTNEGDFIAAKGYRFKGPATFETEESPAVDDALRNAKTVVDLKTRLTELEKLSKSDAQALTEASFKSFANILGSPWAVRTEAAADAKQREELVDFASHRLHALMKQVLEYAAEQMKLDLQRLSAEQRDKRDQEAAEKLVAIKRMEDYLEVLRASSSAALDSQAHTQLWFHFSGERRWALDFRPTPSMERLANFIRFDPDGRRRYCESGGQCF